MNQKIVNIVYVLLLVGAFFTGRFTAPSKVEEKTNIVEVEKEKIKEVEVEKIVYVKVKDNDIKRVIEKEKTEEIRPDGTKVINEKEKITEEDKSKESEGLVKEKEVLVEKIVEVEKFVEVVRIVESKKPQWSVSARVGVDAKNFNITNPPIVIGAEVDRRILGPLSVGVWGQSDTNLNSLSTGVAVRFDF